MDKLLTKKDLAERWQVTETSIDNWRRENILQPCEGVPVIRFSAEYIAKLEGVKLDKMSPLERRRLEQEVEQLKEENKRLKSVVVQAQSLFTSAVFSISK